MPTLPVLLPSDRARTPWLHFPLSVLRGLEPPHLEDTGVDTGHSTKDKSDKNGGHISLTFAADKYQYLEKGVICVQMKHRSKIHHIPNELLAHSSLFLTFSVAL